MLLIRRFEEQVIKLHSEGLVPGHTHVYIGEEATAAGASTCLSESDALYATHRNHGHLLARGADPKRLLAEILGRATGYNGGRGGTMHTVVPNLGVRHTSAMVGGILPLAAGSALAFKQQHSQSISAAFFGDGSLEEGVFYETMNITALWKLPVVYVCENNSLEALGVSQGETPSSTLASSHLTDFPAAFGLATAVVDGGDPVAVNDAVGKAVAHARSGAGPSFVEARTVRWPGTRVIWPELVTGETNISMAWDASLIPAEHSAWFTSHDPVLRLTRLLIQDKLATADELLQVDNDVRSGVEEARLFALDSPLPPRGSATNRVFAEVR